jgi:surface protein
MYDVNISISPSNAGSVSPPDTSIEENKQIELQANGNKEYIFSHWNGDVDSTSDNPLTLTIDQQYNITANFKLKSYELTVNTEGEGTVSEEVLEQKSKEYEHGTVVELTANPAEGYKFVEWQGDVTGNENPTQITIDEAKSVTAVFEKKIFTLSIDISGQGSVSKSPDQTEYEYGAEVELTANPAEGYKFVEWQGDISSSENPVQISINQQKQVNAIFKKPFYLGKNGVTIKCPKAEYGDKGTVNGTTYTKRSADQITENNAETTCTSGITDMSRLFEGKRDFNGDISSWDVSNVVYMDRMFEDARSFNQNLNNWNVSNVAKMNSMFNYAFAFNGDISNWDVGKVTDMTYMFFKANSFNQDLNNWDVSNVNNMEGMFYGASAFNGKINNWDVSKVTRMVDMFYAATSFNQDLSNWDVSNVTDMDWMFNAATSFNGKIGSWDVSNVSDMNAMFRYAKSFNQNLNNWNVKNVRDMSGMFLDAESFNGEISSWDVSNVSDMGNMFSNAISFNRNISNWNVSNVKDMGYMFKEAKSFNQDIGNWDVSDVTDMDAMFYYATSFNVDISGWCVSNIEILPRKFSTQSPLKDSYKPVWGTCPE